MHDKCADIVKALKHSAIKAGIVRFFKDNPYAMDVLPGLAIWVFQPKDTIAPEVEELVSLGILRRYGTEPGAVYSYTKDMGIRVCIEEHWPEIKQATKELRASQTEQEG